MGATFRNNLLGAYIGIPGYNDSATIYSSFTNAMGQAPVVLTEYVDPNGPESTWAGSAAWSANGLAATPYAATSIPSIGIPMAANGENADASFRAIASGSEDAVFNGIFQAYASVGYKSFYIRPGWEMNGNWEAWSVTPANAADFVAAFQRIAALAHAFSGATIQTIWNPAAGGGWGGPINTSSYYPGNQAVDVIGMDQYGVDAGGTSDSAPFDTTTDPTQFTLKDALAMAVANNKPFALPEVGGGTYDTTFPANMASVIAGSGAQVAFVSIWDAVVGGINSLYWSDTPATAAAWKEAFAAIVAGSPSAPPPTPTPAPTPIFPPSPSGTTITSASGNPIIDQAGNAWTLVQSASKGLQIAVNGMTDSVTSNVVLLETLNGAIVQENTSNAWYMERSPVGPWSLIPAPTPTPAPTPSPSGTTITSASGNPIIDQAGNAWTLVQSASKGLQIAVNGMIDPVTSNVVLLETLNGAIVQKNTSNDWYMERSPAGPWSLIPAPAPTPAPTPSPSGTTITSASGNPIIDQAGNAWTLVQSASKGLQIAVNGMIDPVTSNVVLLETLNGAIVQKNTSNDWYMERSPAGPWSLIPAPAPTPTPIPTRSANNTVVMAGSNTAIVDANANKWTITAGGQIAVNGTVDSVTANVVELVYTKDTVWQENTSALWWSKTAPGAAWSPAAGTATPPVSITVTNNGTKAVTTIDATKIQTATDDGATFHLTAPGVAQVTLGGTSETIHFGGMSSETLTAGSATAIVTSDGGTNTFIAGKGQLNVTGGVGADTYVYHTSNARLTVQDFSLANGDTLKVDAILQGSLKIASDGGGGTLLTFGIANAGIDLKGIATLPITNIHWS